MSGGTVRSLAVWLGVLSSAWPALAQPYAWTEVSLVARSQHAIAYDSARGVTVLFGGGAPHAPRNDTWEWDGTLWRLRATDGPSPRNAFALAYDSARGVTVLYGGWDGARNYEDTWEWDGRAWALRATTGPGKRSGHALSYDAARGVTVLFGGARDAETWEWNGTLWRLGAVSGPVPRGHHSMAYDSLRGVTVLFGGSFHDGKQWNFYKDTWEWDGDAWTFRTDSGPSARRGHTMSYDAARGVAVLFGGSLSSRSGDFNGETWEWDGTTWTRRITTGPSPRYLHAMAYDRARAVAVLWGGL